ncbi:isoprenyl transferase [Marinomonas foliarum]|jgi:undecaprenyl diphosphate synthase|uniref:Ditrans,polycis-undecaprenyl-diphosphate synthase ((2E,6E)-farnesyl-diphosphate specific) n=1 Tax=Marinomonas foliarum TaxID=491950 RepID=A0A369AFY8_9GAMM|nr:isoprenyl transferase [Marinomonas foliarum]QRV24818.1 isoprenyl transferase [Marinomonas foliarum]RCX08063.1 undecaprenyl diphosphate synthase [Marinomonas foliarum]
MSEIDGADSDSVVVPHHIAIIMDGNNRWAKKKHLPSIAGHTAGASAVRRVVEASARSGVKVLTLFAFSSENWKRPKMEVDGLMKLFMRSLKKELKRLNEHKIRLRVIGDLSGFSKGLREQIESTEDATKDNNQMTLVIAANYGGRWDIAEAAKKVAERVAAGELLAEEVNESSLAEHMQLADLPSPDLLIRTSGEERISNFMLWQTAYSEFVFLPVLWPDFDQQHFDEAIQTYQNRQRRYGGR